MNGTNQSRFQKMDCVRQNRSGDKSQEDVVPPNFWPLSMFSVISERSVLRCPSRISSQARGPRSAISSCPLHYY